MSRTLTEKKVLNKLGIDSFREITKDKVIEIVSLYDKMDPEVAKKALEQFPDFSKTMTAVMKDYKTLLDESLKEDSKSSQEVFDTYNRIIEACISILEKDDLSFDEKNQVMHFMAEIANQKAFKDSENKRFKAGVIAMGLFAGSIIINAALGTLGVNTRVSFKPTH